MYELHIAYRYFKSRKRAGTFALMNFLTILGVALGVFSMLVVIAVMNGLETDVKEKLLRGTSHIFVFGRDDQMILDWESLSRRIRVMEHVDAQAPCYLNTGLVSVGGQTQPVVIKGIIPELETEVIDLKSILREGTLEDILKQPTRFDPDIEPPGRIIMGNLCAIKLGLLPRERVKLIFTIGDESRVASFTYVAAFETGFPDFDEDMVMVPFEDLQRLFGLPSSMTGIQIRIDDLHDSGRIARDIADYIGADYRVEDWRTLHSNLFAAMTLEKKAMSVILFILILVAASGIAGGVAILITRKRKEIGILKSLGAQNNSILSIFLLEGLTIGIYGILAGGLTGILFCYLADRYQWIHVNIEFFGTFYVPFILGTWDIILIATGAVIICLTAALLPAWKAANIDPIRAIRE